MISTQRISENEPVSNGNRIFRIQYFKRQPLSRFESSCVLYTLHLN